MSYVGKPYGQCIDCGATPPNHEDGCAFERGAEMPECMAPDGAEPCAAFQRLQTRLDIYREQAEIVDRKTAELVAENTALQSKLNHASALTVELQTEVRALRGKLDSARLALRDIMSRSNPQEWAFQRAHEALKDVGFPK